MLTLEVFFIGIGKFWGLCVGGWTKGRGTLTYEDSLLFNMTSQSKEDLVEFGDVSSSFWCIPLSSESKKMLVKVNRKILNIESVYVNR